MQTIIFYRKENALIVKGKYNHKKEDKSASVYEHNILTNSKFKN